MQRPVGAHTRRPVQDPPGAHDDEGPGEVPRLLSACHVRDDRQVADAVVPVAAATRAKASLDRLATDGHRLVAEARGQAERATAQKRSHRLQALSG